MHPLIRPSAIDMFSYYGIAGSITISLINYVLLGFQFPVDGFFMHSFEIFLATTVVFWGSGTVGYTLLEYRLGHKKLVSFILSHWLCSGFECTLGPLRSRGAASVLSQTQALTSDHDRCMVGGWFDGAPAHSSTPPPGKKKYLLIISLRSSTRSSKTCCGFHSCEFSSAPRALPALKSDAAYLYSFFFFGGLSIPVTQAILAHLFSYNIQWSATVKEVQRSNFFKEIPKIAKRYVVAPLLPSPPSSSY